ncbi:MAG: DUF4391 domain-containing protein [Methanobrevibacter sp.]|jgi:hypothetical protein|nr:DUF4391 domain-containing protein [Candidatus Methanoflexus mossambicus]
MKIKEILNIPKKCFVGTPMSKKDFYDFAQLKTRDIKIFTDIIDKITWVYALQEENIRITPFKDSIREYTEVHVYDVSLKTYKEEKTDKNIDRIADIILRTIPYPIILVFEYQNKIKLYVSHIKEHLSDSTKIKLEGPISTNWINLDNLDKIDEKLVDSLKLENLSFSHFYRFYSDIVDNINIYNGSKLVGRDLSLTVKLSPDEIKAIQEEIASKNKEIELKKNHIKKETQFNRKIEINIEIKGIEKEIKDLEVKLLEL